MATASSKALTTEVLHLPFESGRQRPLGERATRGCGEMSEGRFKAGHWREIGKQQSTQEEKIVAAGNTGTSEREEKERN